MKTALQLCALMAGLAGCATPVTEPAPSPPALQVASLNELRALAPRLDACARRLSGPDLPASVAKSPKLEMLLPSRAEPGLASHGHYVYLAWAPDERQVYLVSIGGMAGTRSVHGPVLQDSKCLT